MAKTLGLNIPELQKPEKDDLDLRPKAVDEWLDSLPRGNVGETARRLFETLVQANRFKYSYQHRQHFLDASRETVGYVTDAMKRHFVGINSPLPAKNQKIAAATREIHQAIAIGYMICIENFMSHSLFFSDNKLLATLIQRAMNAFGHVLLTCYQTYTPAPTGVWADLHRLYNAAEQNKVLTVSIVDELNVHAVKTTILGEYMRLIILSLASPYRLRHGEVGKVYNVLERWVGKTRLTTPDKDSSKVATKFAVNLASDEAPRALSLSTESCMGEFCRILDTTSLSNAIRKDLKHGFKTGETTITSLDMSRPDLSHDLMKRLLIAWCIVPKRSFPRTQKQENVQVVLGLTTIHQVIISGSKKKTDQEIFEKAAHYQLGQSRSSVNDSKPDVWEMIYFPGDLEGFETLEEQFAKETNNPAVNKKIEQQPETWMILNEGARGYCLQTISQTASRVQVGELLGVRRSAKESTWKWGVGVIRWLRNNPSEGLTLGIEMLTPDAAAIGLRAVTNAKHDYQRTLMLPELRAMNQPTSLITTSVPYRVGQQLVINLLGQEILVKLSKQLLNTGLFAQFMFDIMEEQSAVHHGREEHDDNDPDFSGVWNSI
jgi:hypothetical protein